jgi:hypothetical protein
MTDRKVVRNKFWVLALLLALAIVASVSAQPTVPGNPWKQIGDMHVGRGYHTLTLLADGRVLAVGGVPVQSMDRGAEVFNRAANAWSYTAPMVYQRAFHATALLSDGRALVVGGYVAPSSAEVYDAAADRWSAAAPMSTARPYGHTATVLRDGRVLVVGGCDYVSGCSSRSVEIYDPQADRWTSTGDLNFARGWHTAALLPDGRVLVAGGENGMVPSKTAEIYNPSTGVWTPAAPMGEARSKHVMTAIQRGRETLYLVAGGCCTGGNWLGGLASSEIYSVAANRWTRVGDMSVGRKEAAIGTLPDGSAIVAGGENTEAFLRTAERFNPATMTWTAAGTIPEYSAELAISVLPDGSLVVTGGTRSDLFYIPTRTGAIYRP